MDINQLNCFISVAHTLNFSEAARRNYVSQSTVSRYISDLEKEFGVKLFTRSHRDVLITNEGKILLGYAQEIVGSLNKAKTALRQMRDGGQGRLKIGCDMTSMSFPQQCIAAFAKRYPNITIDLNKMETDDLSRSISGGEYDFCFMPRDMVPESSDIETLSTHTDSLVIVSASRRRSKKLTLSDVSQEKLLLLSEAGAPILYMEVIDLLRSFHVSPKAEIGFDDIQSLLVATASGIGVTILPKSFAEFTSDKRLTTHPVEDADTGLAYVMAWARNTQNPAAGLFIETARKLASGEDNVYGI
ncbi:MAG: LysR family transcriptional regulator [Ruminococcus sp.]|nr:LysR family transcriptional regulator [Ruminococcus sp.]